MVERLTGFRNLMAFEGKWTCLDLWWRAESNSWNALKGCCIGLEEVAEEDEVKENEETGWLTWRFPWEWKAVMSQYWFSNFLSSAVRKWSTFSCRRSVSEKMSFSFFQEAYSSQGKIFTATVSNCSDVVCFSFALYTWAKRPFPTWNEPKSLLEFRNRCSGFQSWVHRRRCWGSRK